MTFLWKFWSHSPFKYNSRPLGDRY